MAVIENAKYSNRLPQAFAALATRGITFEENSALYEAVIKNAAYADKLPQAFEALVKANIPLSNILRLAVINNLDVTEALLKVLDTFEKIGVKFEESR